MKYKVGDKVRIKSIDWYDTSKKGYYGSINCGKAFFVDTMCKYCGREATIVKIIDNNWYKLNISRGINWTDEMLEDEK